MRLLIAGMAALVAVAFAAPSFAQDETLPTPAPAPSAKPKAGASASCQKMKDSSQRNACLKKVSMAKAAKKTKKPSAAPALKQPDLGQAPPAAMPAPAQPSNGTVAVPPLPSKTI